MEQKLNKEKYLKRVIIATWIALAICFIIKLFGGNFFEIICNNQTFISICEFCDSNIVAYTLIAILVNVTNMVFLTLAMCCVWKLSKLQLIVVIISNAIASCFKIFISREFGLIFDIINGVIIPCLFTIKTPRRHWFVILGNVLLIVFQLVSMFIKNIGFGFIPTNGMLISLIYTIDVFIMLILYYLYANLLRIKKENNNNG